MIHIFEINSFIQSEFPISVPFFPQLEFHISEPFALLLQWDLYQTRLVGQTHCSAVHLRVAVARGRILIILHELPL